MGLEENLYTLKEGDWGKHQDNYIEDPVEDDINIMEDIMHEKNPKDVAFAR